MAQAAISLDQARQALSFIPADDRDTWVRMGMALKAEFNDAFDVFDAWSDTASNYNAKTVAATWRSFKRSGRSGIGSLLLEAKNNGFVLENTDYQAPTAEAIAALKKEREQKLALEQKERQQSAENAVAYSQRLWSGAQKTGQSPYLTKKQVLAESCRFLNDTILVPMLDYSSEPAIFVGVQSIKADGTKLFPKGVAKSGSACRLGDYGCNVLMVCEGYATGLSLRMATRYLLPVFVAFDAGNLIKVVALLREKFPQHSLLICADNDQKTKGNPGIKAARKAIKNMPKADIIYPIFAVDDRRSSDFNDLHVNKGLAAVVRQLMPICTHYGVLLGVKNG